MQDTSYYDECRTYMTKYKATHMRRFIALACVLLLNFYIQTFVFATKYAGDSMQAVIYASDGKVKLNPVTGLFAIVFTAVAFLIGLLIFKKAKSPKVKFGYVIGVTVVLGIYTIIGNLRAAGNRGLTDGVGLHFMAFGMGILTLILSVGCLAVAFFAEQTRMKLMFILCGMIVFGWWSGCFGFLPALVMLAMYLAAIPEYKRMGWMMKQPGYPYFNERFDEAQEHSNYEPMHKLDHRSYASMMDLDDEAPAPVNVAIEREHRAAARRMQEGEMDYTLKMSDNPQEMPGIEDVFEKPAPPPEPLPEPELPRADDIPLPTWNEPAVNTLSWGNPDTPEKDPLAGFPETSWDIPEPNWNVPDVNTDIPDLPEIPDIPKL